MDHFRKGNCGVEIEVHLTLAAADASSCAEPRSLAGDQDPLVSFNAGLNKQKGLNATLRRRVLIYTLIVSSGFQFRPNQHWSDRSTLQPRSSASGRGNSARSPIPRTCGIYAAAERASTPRRLALRQGQCPNGSSPTSSSGTGRHIETFEVLFPTQKCVYSKWSRR